MSLLIHGFQFRRHVCVYVIFFLLHIFVWISYLASAIYTTLQAFCSKFSTCFSVLFFPLLDVKVACYLHVSCLLIHPTAGFIPPQLNTKWTFGSFFGTFPVDLIICTFQVLAGENITPKVVAGWKPDNSAPHISVNISAASLLSLSDNPSNLLWGEHSGTLTAVQ